MPATYRKRGKGSADYVSKAWAPAPQQPPKPKQYFILGMEVDYNTYREYSYEKKWTIDGDVLKGFTATLWSLERYATEEHAKDYPIEAANARKILDQIREEITTITGKDNKTMSNEGINARYLATLEELAQAYTQGKEKLATLKNAYKMAENEYNLTLADGCASDLDKKLAGLNLEKAKEVFKNGIEALKVTQAESAANARKGIVDFADRYFLVTPDKMDGAAMQLLQSGAMNHKDIRYMAEQQKDNPTMLRVIASYVDRAASQEENRNVMLEYKKLSASLKEMTSPDGFLDKMDAMARVMKEAVTDNEFMAEGWNKMFNEFMQEAQTAYAEQSEA